MCYRKVRTSSVLVLPQFRGVSQHFVGKTLTAVLPFTFLSVTTAWQQHCQPWQRQKCFCVTRHRGVYGFLTRCEPVFLWQAAECGCRGHVCLWWVLRAIRQRSATGRSLVLQVILAIVKRWTTRMEKRKTVKPRFTNASDHEQFGLRTNFPSTNRLGWPTVSRVTNTFGLWQWRFCCYRWYCVSRQKHGPGS